MTADQDGVQPALRPRRAALAEAERDRRPQLSVHPRADEERRHERQTITLTIDGVRDRGPAGPDDPRGGRRGRHLHPAAVLHEGPRALRQLPGLHGAGQRPAAGRLHPAGRRRAWWSRTRPRSCSDMPPRPHRDAVRRGQPLLHVLREERQLRAAGAGLPLRHHRPAATRTCSRSASVDASHPDILHRPQPLHPVRPLRARLARAGRQGGLRLRRPRAAQASSPSNAGGGPRRDTNADVTDQAVDGLPGRRAPQEARRLRGAHRPAAVTTTSRSARTSRRQRRRK